MTATDEPPLIFWGRCRSGQRWFWTAQIVGGADTHGWADTHQEASRQANAAALEFAGGRYANIHVLHGVATNKLRALNAAKRAAAPPKAKRNGRAAYDHDAEPVGYLYTVERGRYALDDLTWIPGGIIRLPITRKTAKRIYYLRPCTLIDFELGYVDRQELEARGSVFTRGGLLLFAEPPDLEPPKPATPDVKALKAAMAAAHPDRGGTDAEFIAARERYERARRMAGR